MGRVLRIGAGVMGVLLVVMTVGLWILRKFEPEKLMLFNILRVDANIERLIDDQLVLEAVGKNFRVPVVPPIHGIYDEPVWSANGDWGYFIEFRYNPLTSSVRRLSRDGLRVETILDNSMGYGYVNMIISPDGQWLSLSASYLDNQNQPFGSTLLLVYLPNRQIRDLGKELPNQRHLHPTTGQFSTDSMYLTFPVSNPEGNVYLSDPRDDYFVYQVDLSNGQLENAVEKYGGWLYRNIFAEQGLVVVKGLHRHFHIRRDGTDADFYIPLARGEILPQHYEERIEAWIPEHDLLIFNVAWEGGQRVIGFALEGGSPYWSFDNMRFVGVSADFESLYLAGPNNELYRMALDTKTLEKIGSYDSSMVGYGGMQYHGWALPQDPNIFSGEMPLVFKRNPSRNRVWSETERNYILRWIPAPTKHWQPILLFSLGFGLIGISIFGKRPDHLIRQRRRPAA